MLSSRDTPFSVDGWPLVIEDIQRLKLLIGNGANDMNAGAVDATQQAINDLASGLNAHEVDPDAHAALFAAVNDAITAAAAAVPSPLVAMYTGTNAAQTINSGLSATLSSVFTTSVVDELSGAWSSGIFTAPSTGIYSLTASVLAGKGTATLDEYLDLEWIFNTSYGYITRGGFYGNTQVIVTIAANLYMTTGQTATLKAVNGSAATLTMGFTSNLLTIAKLR